MEKVLKEAKQRFLQSPIHRLSCRWCGSEAIGSMVEVKEYVFVECQTCGFMFCPYISQEFMEVLYAQGYHAKGGKVPENGWSKAGALDPVLALFPAESSLKILDFGCGQSTIPDRLREKGHQVTGVDMAEPVRPHPDRLTGNILDLNLEPDQFDIAYSFQVFEHLPEPQPIFKELLRLTKPGGYIFVHTDMDTPEREAGFDQWWYVLPPDHCSYFRTRSFKHILTETPHQLVEENPKYVIIQAIT